MDINNKKILTFQEGCQFLGYKKSYVYNMIAQGKLPFLRPNGRRIFFDRKKLEDWLLGDQSDKTNELEDIVFKSVLTALKIKELSETTCVPEPSNIANEPVQ
jgi:excisionase family DNA binding protein